MKNTTLPIIKKELQPPKLEWIRLTISDNKKGDYHVRQLFPEVGTGSREPSSEEGEIFYI